MTTKERDGNLRDKAYGGFGQPKIVSTSSK